MEINTFNPISFYIPRTFQFECGEEASEGSKGKEKDNFKSFDILES